MTKLVIIAGPTGVGKTRCALETARALDAEIVSADSMQIYRYMNIGTTKPTTEERALVPCHLIDFVEPDEPFDLARYIALADEKIADISSRGKLPLLVGGTGLYIKGLIEGIFEEDSSDPDVRESLRKEVESQGLAHLYDRLKMVDPEAAEKIHPNDTQRVLRALEVYQVTGRTISSLQKKSRTTDPRYDYLLIVLNRNRDELYERIERRIDDMIAHGFVEEVRMLLERSYSPELHSMKAIGYREIARYLKGDIELEDTLSEMKKETRRYAKRQLTWFRAMHLAQWINLSDRTHEENGETLRVLISTFLAHPRRDT